MGEAPTDGLVSGQTVCRILVDLRPIECRAYKMVDIRVGELAPVPRATNAWRKIPLIPHEIDTRISICIAKSLMRECQSVIYDSDDAR